MPAHKRTSPQLKIPNPVELAQLIEGWGVETELGHLIEWGCKLNTIAALLTLLKLDGNTESWETRTGFARRNLNPVINRMAECAADIERLNASENAQILFAAATDGPHDIKAFLFAIPKVLRGYAEFIGGLAHEKELQPHAKPNLDHVRAFLTQYVIRATGQPRDNEVARLLSVALDRPDLTADSQKDWRSKHRGLLRTASISAAELISHNS